MGPEAAPPEGRGAGGAAESLGARFARVAARWPRRIALDLGGRHLRYGELDATANAIAGRLRCASAPDAARVGLVFERPDALVPALLGALKAGRAYVPLDPSCPSVRSDFILKDADVGLLLCDSETEPLVRDRVGDRRALLNVERAVTEAPRPPPVGRVAPDDLASIFYTSGSTGEPKGVCQSHRNLLRYAAGYAALLSLGPVDRVSLLFSYSFSASIPDLFGALLSGAALCPFDVRRRGPAALARWIAAQEISVLHLNPTLFRHVIRPLADAAPLPALRVVDLGGEAAYAADVTAFRRFAPPQCALFHRLAATEASLITAYRVGPDQPAPRGALPVGRPVAGMEVRIESDDGALLGPGEVGEIVLRSRYLSPGYWRRPELTARVFRADAAGGGMRLYRTGDRGRLRADGVLEHLGRRDGRVKIRGFSVEPTEVEGALRAVDGVTDCAVVAERRSGRDTALAAFVAGRPGAAVSAGAIRRSLRQRLPDYMIPARVHLVDALPLGPTGKVDLPALIASRSEAPSDDRAPLAPRDPFEAVVASIWEDELELETLDVRDDYFALGGSSLQAVQIAARIEAQLGCTVAPSLLLEAPTVAQLAARVQRASSRAPASLAVRLRRGAGGPPLFCFPGNGGEPLVFKRFADCLGVDRDCYGVAAPDVFDAARPARSIEAYAARQLAAIREVQPRGPYHFAAYSFGCCPAIEIAAQLQARGERVALLAMIDGWAPGHPHLTGDVSALQRLLDRWLGSRRLERHRATTRSMAFHAGKALCRDWACWTRERLGRPLDPVERRRRRKRAAIRARSRYRPPRFDGRILLVRSGRPHHDGVFDRDPLRGWTPFASDGIETRDVDCAHRDLLAPPHVERVARWVAAALAALPRPPRPGP